MPLKVNKIDQYIVYFAIFFPIAIVIGPGVADLNLVIICLLFLLICFSYKEMFISKKILLLLFFINLYFIFCSLLSNNILFSLQSSLFYFRFSIFTIAMLYILKSNKNFIIYFTYVIFFTTFLISIDSIIEFITSYSFINLFIENNYSTTGRISGIFGNEYILGSYLVRSLPLIIGLVIYLKDIIKINKKIMFFYLVSISTAIFVSGERTAIFMLLLIYFLGFIFIKEYLKQILLFILLSVLILTFLIFKDSNFKKRVFDKTINDIFITSKHDNFISDKSNLNSIKFYRLNFFSVQHEVVYNTAYKIIKDYPLFGIGPKMFRIMCKNEEYRSYTQFDRSVNGCQTHPHNTYIQMFVETGIFGFIIIILFYFFIFLKYLKNLLIHRRSKISGLKYLEVFCLINILINLWPLMPTGNFFNNWLSAMYYLPLPFLLYSFKTINNN